MSINPTGAAVIHPNEKSWENKLVLAEQGFYHDKSIDNSSYGTAAINDDTLNSLASNLAGKVGSDSVFTKIKHAFTHPFQSLTHLFWWVLSPITSWFKPKPSADATEETNPLFAKNAEYLPENMHRLVNGDLAEKQKVQVRQVERRRLRSKKEDDQMDPKAKAWMNQMRRECQFEGEPTPMLKRAYECAFGFIKKNKDEKEIENLSQKFGKAKNRKPIPDSMQPKKEPSKAMKAILNEVEESKKQLREAIYSSMRIKNLPNITPERTQELFENFDKDAEINILAQFLHFTKKVN